MSQKKRHISPENQYFLKIEPPAEPGQPPFDFERSYDNFSETPVQIILLHSVDFNTFTMLHF